MLQTLLKYVLSDPQRNAGTVDTAKKIKKIFRFHVLLGGTIETITIFFIQKKPECDENAPYCTVLHLLANNILSILNLYVLGNGKCIEVFAYCFAFSKVEIQHKIV